jgi:2-C-methyl-D-erythritol 4-phosphate cytidylyltransferase
METPVTHAAAVIVGGGSGNRYGGDKLTALIAGKPVITWTMQAFQAVPSIESIVLVVPQGREAEFRSVAALAGISKLTAIVTGGSNRHESVRKGLLSLSPGMELVAIHDAARPLVSPELIGRCLQVASQSGASAAASPVSDTLHQVDQEGCAIRTIDRSGLWAMQTPQVFPADALKILLETQLSGTPTDEVSVALSAGWRIPFVENHEPNLKITWPSDLMVAEALLRARSA